LHEEDPDHRQCPLLRLRDHWPRRRASQPRDEFAPLH
jgi:hypothetical protein